MDDTKTPRDLVRELGIEGHVSSLVNLAMQNPTASMLQEIVEFAMAMGVGGHVAYQARGFIMHHSYYRAFGYEKPSREDLTR